MLFAASVKITHGKNRRRLDVIVEAPDLETAKEKALKQARNIYAPSKKAAYTLVTIIDEAEARRSLTPRVPSQTNEIIESDADTH